MIPELPSFPSRSSHCAKAGLPDAPGMDFQAAIFARDHSPSRLATRPCRLRAAALALAVPLINTVSRTHCELSLPVHVWAKAKQGFWPFKRSAELACSCALECDGEANEFVLYQVGSETRMAFACADHSDWLAAHGLRLPDGVLLRLDIYARWQTAKPK